jgi:hypothetical protein
LAVPPRTELRLDEEAGVLTVILDDREIMAYQFGKQYALPHYWPLRSPSGKLLTAQNPDPYPHHRSVWIADKIQVGEKPAVDFYHCWKNYKVKGDPKSGYRHFIRHQGFIESEPKDGRFVIRAKLQWIMNESTPVIDESRSLRVVPFDNGEYMLDLAWELRAVKDEVRFVSDWVHYAWPYLRMHPQFSGEQGATITDDQGNRGQQGTNEKVAKWIDYCNTVDGRTEGLAVLIYPDGKTRKWLTREYGTFGPRRSDERSGSQFTLRSGELLQGRVGILVHEGDATAGRVAERYQHYIEGKL